MEREIKLATKRRFVRFIFRKLTLGGKRPDVGDQHPMIRHRVLSDTTSVVGKSVQSRKAIAGGATRVTRDVAELEMSGSTNNILFDVGL